MIYNNLLIGAGTVADLAVAALLVITVIVGLCTGFMKNGLNNLCFALSLVGAVLLVPVFKRIGFIAGLIDSLAGAFSFIGSETTQSAIAGGIVSVVLFLVLFIVFLIVCAIVKKILRAFIKPKHGLGKLLDRIFGAVFGVAFYGVVLFTLLGVVGTLPIEGVQNALAGSKFQQINFMQDFCEEKLNLGDLLKSLGVGGSSDPEGGGETDDEGGGTDGGAGDTTETPADEGGGTPVLPETGSESE